MLKVEYLPDERLAVLYWDGDDAPWMLMRRILEDHTDEVVIHNPSCISVPWWSFLSCRSDFAQIVSAYGVKVETNDLAKDLLAKALEKDNAYKQALHSDETTAAMLMNKLYAEGFERSLTIQQLRNVTKLCSLPAGATFSVPGAGKTTEALCYFFYRRNEGERLLVIAPKNAFGSWEEQFAMCFPKRFEKFVRLRGGEEKIKFLLHQNPPLMLITYQQLPRVRDLIASNVTRIKTFVFLDESHRIKAGKQKQTPEAVLSMSHLPVGKLIMSGTPMPQDISDLIPQFSFLYPEIAVSRDSVIEKIKPVYVRTNKKELGLPEVNRRLIELNMTPVQSQLYLLMRSEVARLADEALSLHSIQAFRNLGRSVLRLLKLVSNPALLVAEIGFAHQDFVGELLAEGDSPKLKYVCNRARELAKQGHKVLIWSSFVANVELISERLSDLGAVYIHGGVDAGDEDEGETREGKIKRFHDDPTVWVLVANPAAASEGISLHTVCHNAIYMDRTFNAAHYLQSEDRIHRLGLRQEDKTIIEIVECSDTIDEAVRTRLNAKVARMAEALEDDSLRVDPIPYDPLDGEDEDEYTAGLAADDVRCIIDCLKED